jgi:hypothetical protein
MLVLGFVIFSVLGWIQIEIDKIRPPYEISAQTDQQCPSYGLSKFCKKDQFLKKIFFLQNCPNKRNYTNIFIIIFFLKILTKI